MTQVIMEGVLPLHCPSRANPVASIASIFTSIIYDISWVFLTMSRSLQLAAAAHRRLGTLHAMPLAWIFADFPQLSRDKSRQAGHKQCLKYGYHRLDGVGRSRA